MPLHVLFVGNYLTGGSRPVTLDLAAALRRQGHQVTLTSSQAPRLRRLADMLHTAIARRRDYAVAVVDVYSGWAFIYAEVVCAALRALGKPYVLTLHGGNLPAFGQRWPGRVRRLLASAARVTAPSPYLAEAMRGHAADLQVIPNGLELGRYRCRLRDRPGPTVLWLRAFHRIYDPALAPAVVARLLPEFPDLRLSMVGPDKGDGSLEATRAELARLGVGGSVELVGPVHNADVPHRMERADVFLNTALVDNTPVSVLEAMATGLCVVSTDVGGLRFLLTHEEDALLVPSGDSDALADAIRRVLTEPGLAARLSANARRRAAQFDWDAVAPRWVALLSSVRTSSAG